MSRHMWCRAWQTPGRQQPLAAVKSLLWVLLGVLILGQCLTANLHATPLAHPDLECHEDCWYQRPSWLPVAMLPYLPDLPAPQPVLRLVALTNHLPPGHGDHQRAVPPRSPPRTTASSDVSR